MVLYLYQKQGKHKTKGEIKMTKAEERARKAYEKELIKSGVDKEMAKTLAKVMTEYGIVRPVVNGN